jgi:hypothetical protein
MVDCANPLPGYSVLSYPECTLYVVGQIITAMIYGLLLVGALFTLYSFVYAAWLYLTAGDDRDKTAQSWRAMVWSVVGLFGIGGVFVFFRFIVGAVPNLRAFIVF